MSITDELTVLRQHRLNRRHDTRRRPILPHVESSLNEEHSDEHNSEGKVRWCRWLAQGAPSDEDEDRGEEKDSSKTLEEVSEYCLRSVSGSRRWGVFSIVGGAAFDLVW